MPLGIKGRFYISVPVLYLTEIFYSAPPSKRGACISAASELDLKAGHISRPHVHVLALRLRTQQFFILDFTGLVATSAYSA